MKKIFILFFLSFFLMAVGSHIVWGHTDVTPQEAENLINTKDELLVVDVREEESEYCKENPTPPVPPGHISGALNYPWSSGVLQERYEELSKEREILVVCRSGNRSNKAAEFLDSKGYIAVYDMTEGMSEWEGETVLCSDSDEDGINDDLDNCPDIYNPNQKDRDENGLGDTCDSNAVPCLVGEIYGDNSEVTEQLRNYRNERLNKTALGREVIKIYYRWSPVIVNEVRKDEVLQQALKSLIDDVVPTIQAELKKE